jgi:hypothetical protein
MAMLKFIKITFADSTSENGVIPRKNNMIQGNTLRNSWIIIQWEIGTLGVLIYEVFGNSFWQSRFRWFFWKADSQLGVVSANKSQVDLVNSTQLCFGLNGTRTSENSKKLVKLQTKSFSFMVVGTDFIAFVIKKIIPKNSRNYKPILLLFPTFDKIIIRWSIFFYGNIFFTINLFPYWVWCVF